MRKKLYVPFLIASLTMLGILQCNNLWSQTGDTANVINIPLPYEDLSLYDFLLIRTETDKTEKPLKKSEEQIV